MREEQGALRSSSSRDTPDARACLSLSNAFCPRRDVALLLAPVLVIFQHRERERFFSLFVFFPSGQKRSGTGSDRMRGYVRSSSGKETDHETCPKLSPGEAALVSASRA